MSQRISVGENLSRQHGLFNRLIMLYRMSVLSSNTSKESLEVLRSSAELMNRYIHEFHEEYEEHTVYPIFKDDKMLHELSEVMEEQHEIGKEVTATILDFTAEKDKLETQSMYMLKDLITEFERMYVPHAAQEDTVMWMAIQAKVGDDAYMQMGEDMNRQAEEKFGKGWFDKAVVSVAKLEKTMALDDLSQFTVPTDVDVMIEEAA